MERVTGIEPVSSVWKTDVLPLYYTRLVGLEARLLYVLSVWLQALGVACRSVLSMDCTKEPV